MRRLRWKISPEKAFNLPTEVIVIATLIGKALFTLIAVKLGEEPDPLREPEEPLDRILRYEELEANE